MDKSLEEKYRKGVLSKDEFTLLKRGVAEEPADRLYEKMEQHWRNGDIDESDVPEERVRHLYDNIRKAISQDKVISSWQKWIGIAAALIIPFCLLFTAKSVSDIRRQSSQELLISTAKGEQSTISLPDGTTVKLNELSSLKYSPGSFSGKKRVIHFVGEGYFNVTKRENNPFTIKADRMTATVLGTTFNLQARLEDSFNKLLLIEGRVQLESSVNGDVVILEPNEEVTLDKGTGKMVVNKITNKESSTSWLRKEIVFKRISLKDLLGILSTRYDVAFTCGQDVDMEELFTGTLYSDDLLSCLEIIEYAYGLEISLSRGEAIVKKK